MHDVVVIGGGLAGWRAAEAAVKAGCSVALIANGAGNSPHVHALNCPVLPEDSAERMFADTMSSGHGTNDPALVRVLCEGAVRLKDEFAFDRNPDGSYKLIQPLGSSVPRCVSINHAIGSHALVKIMAELEGHVDVIYGRATSLMCATNVSGAPRGAEVPAWGGGAGRATNVSAAPRGAETSTTYLTSPPPPSFPGKDRYAISCVHVTKGMRVDHWEFPNGVYHVCFRLDDSVPQEVLLQWAEEREGMKSPFNADEACVSMEEREKRMRLFSEKVDAFLDAGHGECLLARKGVYEVMESVLRHDDGVKYVIHAIGIMSNHLHVVVQPLSGCSLKETVDQWKRVSAHRINKVLVRTGAVWRDDHYNRIIRDRDEYENQMRYVLGNDRVWSWRREGKTAPRGAAETGVELRREGAAETFCVQVVLPAPRGAAETGEILRREGAAETFPARPAPQLENAFPARPAPQMRTFHARAVVIATGGWCGKYDFSTNPSYLRGDGIALAQSVGAAVRDMDQVQYEPTVRVEGPQRGVPVITTLLYKGATLRNDAGEEFLADNRLNKDVLSQAILAEMARTQASGVWYDLTAVAEEDMRACKMDPSVRHIRIAPAPHTSLGGVCIDTACRVLDAQGAPIAGLFAAGEVTGGLHGANRLGGNAGTEILVFGKIAGESAAAYVAAVGKGEDR